LKNVKLFAELSTDSLLSSGSCLKIAEFRIRGYRAGGRAGVRCTSSSRPGRGSAKKDPTTGFDFLVAQLSEGAAVGEMSLLTESRGRNSNNRSADGVFTLTRADFRNLLTQHPKFRWASPASGRAA